MSTFVEFQKTILDKLCSIEDRLTRIEAVLNISDNVIPETIAEPEQSDFIEAESSDSSFIDEISDFQKQLNDIKSLFE